MKRRILPLIVSLALCLGMVSPAALAADTFIYSDETNINGTARTYTGGSGDNITITQGTYSVIFNVSDTLTVNNAITNNHYGADFTIQSGTVRAGSMNLNYGNLYVSGGNLLVTGSIATSHNTIQISSGYVTASSIDMTGSLGAYYGHTLTITGGIVDVGSIKIQNPGTGYATFTVNGNSAVVFADEVTVTAGGSSSKNYQNGVVFEGTSGTVYGEVTLPDGVTIPDGYTLTIPSGASLTVPSNTTLTNEGTITVEDGGTFTNSGTIENYGKLPANTGGTILTPATVDVSVSSTTATYGSTVTLTATVKDSNDAAATSGTVNFYQGTDTSGNPLNSTPANVSNGQATYNLTLNDASWTPSDTAYTITAVYTPASGSSLLSGSDDATLTVSKGTQDTPPAAPNVATATTNSVTLTAVSGSNIEYGYTTGTGGQPGNWQTETIFNNLSAGTDYTFYTRYAETDYYEASDPSTTGLTVTTLPTITTTSLDAGNVGVQYNETLEAIAASGKVVTWALASGSSLPAGLTLNESGTITGSPSATATSHSFTVQATISGGADGTQQVSNTATLTITINQGTPDITITSGSGTYAYGDTITITGSIAASTTAPGTSTNSITQNQVGLYLADGTELATANVDTNDGSFTLTYATSQKGIEATGASQNLTVKYGGSSDLISGSTAVDITLSPKPVTATVTNNITKVYDGGTDAEVSLAVASSDLVNSTDDITVTGTGTYQSAEVGNNIPVTVSNIQADGTDKNWYSVSAPGNVYGSITQSSSTLSVQPSSTNLTYGDTLTITVTPTQTGEAPDNNALTPLDAGNTVELYNGDTLLTGTSMKNNDGTYTLTYNTTGKGLTIGENTLTVKFNGDTNMTESTAYVTVTLSKKQVTASVSSTPEKTYDMEPDVEVSLTFADGVLAGGDTLTGTVSGNFADANAGESKAINLDGDTVEWTPQATAGFYNITLPSNVTGTITQAEIDNLPVITGSAIPGGTLTASYTPDTGETVSFQWNLDGTLIPGATGDTYTSQAEQVGQEITVTATATDGNHTGSATSLPVTVGKGSQDAPAADEGYAIDYRAETITADEGYELAETDTASSGSATLTATPGGTVYVRLAETSALNPSPWTAVNIPARPAAPTTPVGGDQLIRSVDATMEYRATFGTDQSWKNCDGHSVTGLAVGDYQVRFRATSTAFASETITVHVYHDSGGGTTNPSYPPSVSDTENGTVTVSPTNPKEGDTVTITTQPKDRYKVDTITVTDEDGELVDVTQEADNTYTFVQPKGKVTIEVTFDVDLPFTDVPEGAWYIEGAKYAYANYLMNGTSETTFSPSTPVSRGMIMQILYNMAGQPDVEGGSSFTDVSEGYWSADAIAWAVENGVAGGFGDGTFRPDDDLTREQLAVILRNFAYQMGWDISATGDLSRFTDIGEDNWARDALSWAFAEGLLTGTGESTMDPTGQASRAQVAVIMMRFCQRYANS